MQWLRKFFTGRSKGVGGNQPSVSVADHVTADASSDPGYVAWLEAEGLAAVEGAAREEAVELSQHRQQVLSELLGPTLDKLSPEEHLAAQYAALLPPDAVPLPWLKTLVGQQFLDLMAEPKLGA